jgi:predicted CXXCH cytochrome family protein
MVMSGQSPEGAAARVSRLTRAFRRLLKNPPRRAIVAGALVLLIGLGIAAILLRHRLASSSGDTSSPSPEPADPRRTYNGPYRNIHPDVHYVGDGQCTGCHESIAQSYARHPMGRSLVPVGTLLDRQVYTPDTNNPFTLLGRRFLVERQGEHLWHRQALLDPSGKPVVELSQEVRWVIGSGAKGYSYVSEQDGYLFQTAISWFSHQQRWDLSPGFGPAVLTGRRVSASCLYCHANGVWQHPQQPDRFVPPVFAGQAIGCERCHGPGELHVQSADRWDIVNPTRLTPPLRDAVCEQCHLEGEARVVRGGRKLFDFRPGLPLHKFWAVLVQGRQSGEDAKAVNHVEQMYQSKCFSRPVGDHKLGCVSCHDPHVWIGPKERQSHYRARCLQCHNESAGQRACSEPLTRRRQVSAADSCIDCHMPRYRSWDIAHTASTDHRIVRRPTHQPVRATNLESATFVDFYRDRFAQGDPQIERNLGLGLVKMMDSNMLSPPRHGDRALRLLELALGVDPSDTPVRQGKVEVYSLLNRPAEALSEAQVLLPERPGDWNLLTQAAYAAQACGQTDLARDYWRQAVAINPFVPENQMRLVALLIQAGQLEEARTHCEQLLRQDPFNIEGRQAWVDLLLRRGQRAEAQRAFDVIRQLKPPDLARREEWFQQQMR